MFDAASFLSSKIKGEMSTQAKPVPQGDHKGVIEPITKDSFREVNTKDGVRYILRLGWDVSTPEVLKVTGRKTAYVNQDIWLDLDEKGRLDNSEGMNVGLGRVRAAVGQNEKGKDWSVAQLAGAVAVITVNHRIDEKTGNVYADVSRVAKLA